MAIITISRGSYSKGKQIAEGVAARLGYECISRDVLLETSEQYDIPEVKLVRALHDAPGVLGRFTHGKERYVSYIERAFLDCALDDDVVYHGLAGHFFLKGISHVLKVRILADMEDRVALEMTREGIHRDEALHVLRKDDEERRKWSLALYGIDTADPVLYDLTIHIRKLTVADAVDLVCTSAELPHFRTTPESRRALEDLILAARAKCRIVSRWPLAQVAVEEGIVIVHVEAPLRQEPLAVDEIRSLIGPVTGVKEVRVSVRPTSMDR